MCARFVCWGDMLPSSCIGVSVKTRNDAASGVKTITEDYQVSKPELVHCRGAFLSVIFILNLLHCISGKPVCRGAPGPPWRAASVAQFW